MPRRLALAYKGIPYDTIYINLRDKPDWYVKMADGRVPAGECVGWVERGCDGDGWGLF